MMMILTSCHPQNWYRPPIPYPVSFCIDIDTNHLDTVNSHTIKMMDAFKDQILLPSASMRKEQGHSNQDDDDGDEQDGNDDSGDGGKGPQMMEGYDRE